MGPAFPATLQRGELSAVDGMTDAAITREGGKSAHEIRAPIGAFAALAAAGPYRAEIDYYRAIPEWIAGFAVMHAAQAGTDA